MNRAVARLLFASLGLWATPQWGSASEDTQPSFETFLARQNDLGFLRDFIISDQWFKYTQDHLSEAEQILDGSPAKLVPRAQVALARKLLLTKRVPNEKAVTYFAILWNQARDSSTAMAHMILLAYYMSMPSFVGDDEIFSRMVKGGWKIDRRIFDGVCQSYKKTATSPEYLLTIYRPEVEP